MSLVIGIIIVLIIIISVFWITKLTAKYWYQRIALRIMLNLEKLRDNCREIQANMSRKTSTPFVEISHMTHLVENNFARSAYDLAKMIYTKEIGLFGKDQITKLVKTFKSENTKLLNLTDTLALITEQYEKELESIKIELDEFIEIVNNIQKRNSELIINA